MKTIKTTLALLYYEFKYTYVTILLLRATVQVQGAYRFSSPPIGLPETKLYWILDPREVKVKTEQR